MHLAREAGREREDGGLDLFRRLHGKFRGSCKGRDDALPYDLASEDRQTDRQRRQQAAKAFAEKQNINYNNNNNNNKRGGGIIIGCLP